MRDTVDVFLAGLDELPENYLHCRELQHVWKTTRPFHRVDASREVGRKMRGGLTVYVERVMTCTRCGMERTDSFRIARSRGRTTLRKIAGRYSPPEGYSIPGTSGVSGLVDYLHGAAFEHAMAMEEATTEQRTDVS